MAHMPGIANFFLWGPWTLSLETLYCFCGDLEIVFFCKSYLSGLKAFLNCWQHGQVVNSVVIVIDLICSLLQLCFNTALFQHMYFSYLVQHFLLDSKVQGVYKVSLQFKKIITK